MDAKDTFYDCLSDSDDNEEHFTDICNEMNANGVGDGHGDMDGYCGKQMVRFDDPAQIRAVLERTQKFLRCYGGDGQSGSEDNTGNPRSARFYPATLEINARLHAEESCSCPKDCQCKLRGDPVTLKLPIELNPLNGHVNVDIFQTKSLGPPLMPRKCLCEKQGKQTNKLPSCRTVRWSQEEDLDKDQN